MKNILNSILFTSAGIMVLTIIHHGYGALIYEEPFRLHVAFFAVPVLIVLYATFRLSRKHAGSRSGTIALWVFLVTAVVFPVGFIGLFEGAYNHLLKNILYFAGSPESVLIRLFPPPTYEMPNNFWFEATGIMQFVVACMNIYYLLMLRTASAAKLQEVQS